MRISQRNFLWLKIIPFLVVILVASIGLGCGAPEDPAVIPPATEPGQNEVIMQNNAYTPQTLTVPVGTSVTWTNRDTYPHTVTSGTRGNPTGLFDSGNINENGTYTYTFQETGTYPYYCTLHPGMDGTIIVQ